MEEPTQLQHALKIATDILRLSANTLVVNMRFLDEAIFRLSLVPEVTTYAVDGEHLFFGYNHVFARYKSHRNAVTHDYLHMVMHCVFRHSFVNTLVDNRLWDIACDIAVEGLIQSLNIPCVETDLLTKQVDAVNRLSGELKNKLTAERLYRYLLDCNVKNAEIERLQELFAVDDHSLWYTRNKPDAQSSSIQSDNNSDNNGSSQGDSTGDKQQKENTGSLSVHTRAALEQEWREISERMQVDMETISHEYGTCAGNMAQQLGELNRERYDYTEFLKKFAVMSEVMQVNDDEFDYIFYTYGLKLYDNMPLIEPLEYKEVKRIREFVIAIDTSGSTSGELVQTFLNKTYNVLKSTDSFFSKVNIRIIQCDAEIQESVVITTDEEFDKYIKHMTIKGCGGTDFRPVFKHVNELIQTKEFTNLKGLIYFTDGCGTYPTVMPDYSVAFVFIQDEYNDVDVPPWAMKLILEKDEI